MKKTGDMAIGQIGFHKQKMVTIIRVEKRINETVNRLNKTKIEKLPDLKQEKEDRDRAERNKAKKLMNEEREKEKEEIKKRQEEKERKNASYMRDNECEMETNQGGDNDSDDFM